MALNRIPENFLNDGLGLATQAELDERGLSVKKFGAKGDGVTDDTIAIQNAVKKASETGINHVYFPPTTTAYMVNGQTPIYIPSNMKLSGVKGQSIIKLFANSIASRPDDNYWKGINSMFVPGDFNTGLTFTKDAMGSNIHFRELVMDGNGANVNQTTVDKEWTSSGVHALYTINLSIADCEIRNFMGSGVYTYCCTSQTVRDCIVHNNGKLRLANVASRNGISFAGGYLGTQPVQQPYSFDAIISGNIINNNSDEGIMFGFQKRILITDNLIHNNGDRGIEGDDGYKTADTGNIPGDCIITNNFVYDHATYGISVASSNEQKIRISSNTIRNCTMYGILVTQHANSDTSITDNFVYDTGSFNDGTAYHAIIVDAQESLIQGNTVENCTNGAGIAIARTTNSSIVGNKIKNTHVGIEVDLWDQAITNADASTIKIDDNQVILSAYDGISISSIAGYKINSLSINGNSILNYNEKASVKTCYGILIKKNTVITSMTIVGNTILDNRVTQKGANGIFFLNGANEITYGNITGNELGMSASWGPIDNITCIEFLIMASNNESGKRYVEQFAQSDPDYGRFSQGDRFVNARPSPGDFMGWVCTAAGNANKTPWISGGTFAANSYVNNAGNVYQNISGGTTAGTIAPIHVSGTISDGLINWEHVGILAVFKGYGQVSI